MQRPPELGRNVSNESASERALASPSIWERRDRGGGAGGGGESRFDFADRDRRGGDDFRGRGRGRGRDRDGSTRGVRGAGRGRGGRGRGGGRGGGVASDGATRGAVARKGKPAVSPVSYLEHLLGKLDSDEFMLALANKHGGWLPIDSIAGFGLPTKKGWTALVLLDAAEASELIELRGDFIRPAAAGRGGAGERIEAFLTRVFSHESDCLFANNEFLVDVASRHDGWLPLGALSLAADAAGLRWRSDELLSAARRMEDVVEVTPDGSLARPARDPVAREDVVLGSGMTVGALEEHWRARPFVGDVDGADVRVLTFNILAEHMAVKDRATHTRAGGDWEDRSDVILRRIVFHAPSIVALQEVQTDKHAAQLLHRLSDHGYDGVYNHAVITKNTVVLAWHTAQFESVSTWFGIPFLERFRERGAATAGVEHHAHVDRAADALRFAERYSQLGKRRYVYALLKHVATGRLIVACSVHTNVPMVSDMLGSRTVMAEWLNLFDMQNVIAEIDLARHQFVEDGLAESVDDIDVIIGTDANAIPGSAAAEYLCAGQVPADSDVTEQASRAGLPESLVRGVAHPLPLMSAYRQALGREPEWTNINSRSGFIAPLDIIATTLRATAALDVYDLPRPSALFPRIRSDKHPIGWPTPSLPNAVIPSDHVPLEAAFVFRGTTAK